jgi:hypothetical protein
MRKGGDARKNNIMERMIRFEGIGGVEANTSLNSILKMKAAH